MVLAPPPSPRVLLVDGDAAERRRLAAALAAAGVPVVHAEDAAQATALVARRRADVVLFGAAVPAAEALAACRRIRDELAQPMLPLLLAAAAPGPAARAAATAAGAAEVLATPVDPDELVARVRHLARLRDHLAALEAERVQHEALARRWRMVSTVAAAVSGCRDHDATLRALVRALRPLVRIEQAALYEVTGDEIGALALEGVADGPVVGARQPWAAAAWQDRLRGARVVELSPDEAAGTPLAPLVGAPDVRAAVLPAFAGGALDTLLVVARRGGFDADELDLLVQLTPHLANALANVRSHLRAVERDVARRRLSSFLVHDLKNALAVLRLSLDLAASGRTPAAAVPRHVDDARTSADTLLAMLVDLLDIARAEDGRLALDRRRVSLDQLVGDLLVPYAASFRARGVSVRYDAAAELEADVDAKLLRRVVQNLLDNGLRHVPARGRLEVELEADGDDAVLRIGNEGPEIPPEVRARLFEAYGVVHDAQGADNRGFGLYFCQLVAVAHGGAIGVADRPGGGVRFEVRLPRRAPG